jgi:hypothetical protein
MKVKYFFLNMEHNKMIVFYFALNVAAIATFTDLKALPTSQPEIPLGRIRARAQLGGKGRTQAPPLTYDARAPGRGEPAHEGRKSSSLTFAGNTHA